MLLQGSAITDRVVNSLVVFAAAAFGQAGALYQRDFLPDESRSRWEKVFDKIGGGAVAVVHRARRSTNQWFYHAAPE